MAELTPELARQLDLPNGVRGVVVTGVDPDAGAADLQKGDVIEEVNQQPVTSVADYKKIVASLDPNQAASTFGLPASGALLPSFAPAVRAQMRYLLEARVGRRGRNRVNKPRDGRSPTPRTLRITL